MGNTPTLRRLGLPLCVLVALTGCTPRYLRPPPPPDRAFVAIPDPPRAPAEDEGTVTLDVTEGSARVELLIQRTQIDPNAQWATQNRPMQAGQTQGGLVTRPLCRTPCTVNLPRGDHELVLTDVDPSSTRSSSASVRVGTRPSVFRHTLGQQQSSVAGIITALLLGGLSLGATAMGGALLAIGSDDYGTDLTPAGGISLGVGVALGVAAWLLGEASRPTIRPGSTTQWTP